MKPQFTKGPWHVAENNGAHAFVRGDDGECRAQTIAQVWLQGADFNEANAQLIAMAPTLLACLERAYVRLKVEYDKKPARTQADACALQDIQNVIDKAKGGL